MIVLHFAAMSIQIAPRRINVGYAIRIFADMVVVGGRINVD